MIYGVMLRNAEGEGTDFFACVAENFNEAQEICEESFMEGDDFTIINAPEYEPCSAIYLKTNEDEENGLHTIWRMEAYDHDADKGIVIYIRELL